MSRNKDLHIFHSILCPFIRIVISAGVCQVNNKTHLPQPLPTISKRRSSQNSSSHWNRTISQSAILRTVFHSSNPPHTFLESLTRATSTKNECQPKDNPFSLWHSHREKGFCKHSMPHNHFQSSRSKPSYKHQHRQRAYLHWMQLFHICWFKRQQRQ